MGKKETSEKVWVVVSFDGPDPQDSLIFTSRKEAIEVIEAWSLRPGEQLHLTETVSIATRPRDLVWSTPGEAKT